MSKPSKIALFKRGSSRTLLSAKNANQIVGRLNPLLNIRLQPPTAGSVDYSDHDVSITLKKGFAGNGTGGGWHWADPVEYDSSIAYLRDEAVIVSPTNAAVTAGVGGVKSVAGIYVCFTDASSPNIPQWPLPGTVYWLLLSFYPSEITVCVDSVETPYWINAQEKVT